MNYSPLLLFVFNRPEHTTKTLESINLMNNATNTELFIFCDGARGEKDIHNVDQVRTIVRNFSKKCRFKKTTIIEASSNKGLANSIIGGVSQLINKYGRVIVLEDDLITSTDFLDYMNSCLEYYSDNRRIWAISGYTFPLKSLETYKYDVYMSGRGCSWGWATWKNRWEKVDWSVSDYNKFRFDIISRYKFGLWGRDLPAMLDHYIVGNVKSWAIRWCYSAFKNNMLTVYPKHSRIINNGTDGSGTNFSKSKVTIYDTTFSSDTTQVILGNYEVDKKIRAEFRKKFVHGIDLIKQTIVTLLIRTRIRKK